MKDLAICGFGGFAKEVACLIKIINSVTPTWNFKGFFVNDLPKGTETKYGIVLGNDEELDKWNEKLSVVIAIGNNQIIQKLANNLKNPNLDFPNIIHPDFNVVNPDSFRIGKGNIIQSGCYVSCDVTIGNFNVLNNHIIIGHDCLMGDYNVVMPSVNISGGVEIGECNFLGVQSVVLQNLKVGNNVRVGANSVIMRNCKDGFLYLGNPAMKMKL